MSLLLLIIFPSGFFLKKRKEISRLLTLKTFPSRLGVQSRTEIMGVELKYYKDFKAHGNKLLSS